MGSAGVQRKVLDLGFEGEKGPEDTSSSAPALQVLLSGLGKRSEHVQGNSRAGFSSGSSRALEPAQSFAITSSSTLIADSCC